MKIKASILIFLSLIFFACENPASDVLDNPSENNSNNGLLVNDYLSLLELDSFFTPEPLTDPSSAAASAGVEQAATVIGDEWNYKVQDYVWESVNNFDWPDSQMSQQMILLAAEEVDIYEGVDTDLGIRALPEGATGPNGESQLDFGTVRVALIDDNHVEVFHVVSLLIDSIYEVNYMYKYVITKTGDNVSSIEIFLMLQCDQEEALIDPTPFTYMYISIPEKQFFMDSLFSDTGFTYIGFDNSGKAFFLEEDYDETNELESYTGAVSDSQCAGIFEYYSDRIVFEYYNEQSFLLKSERFTQETGSSDTIFNGNNYSVHYTYPLSSLSLVNASATLCSVEYDLPEGPQTGWWLDLNGDSQFDSETETDLSSFFDYQELEVWDDNLNRIVEDVTVPVYWNSNDISGVYFNYTAGHESTISERKTDLETLFANKDTLLTHPKGSTPEFPAISEYPEQ